MISELSESEKQKLEQDRAAYYQANSRTAFLFILSVAGVFGVIFIFKSHALIAPALITVVAIVAWLYWRLHQQEPVCPRCKETIMRSIRRNAPPVMFDFCPHCGILLQKQRQTPRILSDEERERYWAYDRNSFFSLRLIYYVYLVASAGFLLLSFSPNKRGYIIFSVMLLGFVLFNRRYRKVCPACGMSIFNSSKFYCESCGTQLATPAILNAEISK